jgi:hypothetical protein
MNHKLAKTAVTGLLGALLLAGSVSAMARVGVSVGIGVPLYAPPPAYGCDAPYPYCYEEAPYYAPPVVGAYIGPGWGYGGYRGGYRDGGGYHGAARGGFHGGGGHPAAAAHAGGGGHRR